MTRFVAVVVLVGSLILAGQVAGAEPEEGQYYRITNSKSKKDLGISVLKKDEGRVVEVEVGEHPNQQWKFVKVGDYYNIINRRTNKALDVKNASKAEGGQVILSEKGNESVDNQQWSLEKKGEYLVIKARHSGLVLDMAPEAKDREAQLIQVTYKKSDNQHFQLVPIKK